MPPTRLRIFLSSVQKEFATLRHDLKAFLLGDAFLRRFVAEVFLFEELPAGDQRADQIYLAEVECCDLFLAVLGNEYGSEDARGISPTEHEYIHATKHRKPRFIYVWGTDEDRRSPKMKSLIRRASAELVRRRVADTSALNSEVYASLVDYLDRHGSLRTPPFDTSACDGATFADLSRQRIDWFLAAARRERGFPLKADTTTEALLKHLNLMDGRRPTNAAMLLFGAAPQRFHRTAETKCISCHGTEYRRPFASQQIYAGDLFDQADQAREFVLAKINRTVGTRATSISAAVTYELPPDAVAEAIVNALAHRDYHSHASVEVRLFADRLEIWNPGVLPGTLSLDDLRHDHPSVPTNPLIAESLYLTRYIEKAGSGTQRMIELSSEAGLPAPGFEQRGGTFVLTLWRDWLTADVLAELSLNERQVKVLPFIRQQARLSNSDYQAITGTTRATAKRDLEELVAKGLVVPKGRGRGAHYEFGKKRLKNGSNGSPKGRKLNGS